MPIHRLVLLLFVIFLASPVYAKSCPISIAVDLDKKITTKGRSLSEIKKRVNGLINIYEKDLCLYFIGGSALERVFVRLNFDIKKAQTSFIDGK